MPFMPGIPGMPPAIPLSGSSAFARGGSPMPAINEPTSTSLTSVVFIWISSVSQKFRGRHRRPLPVQPARSGNQSRARVLRLRDRGLNVARPPFAEGRFARFVSELARLKGLPRLRHELVAKKLDVVMRGLRFLQRIAQGADRFAFRPLRGGLRGLEVRARLADRSGIFARVHPRDVEGNASVDFTEVARRFVVALAFDLQRWVGNPGPMSELEARSFRRGPRPRGADFRLIGQRQSAQSRDPKLNAQRFHIRRN